MKRFVRFAQIIVALLFFLRSPLSAGDILVSDGPQSLTAPTVFTCNDAHIVLAPYVWKPFMNGTSPEVEAALPGAYLKTLVNGTTTIGIRVDGSANNGHPPGNLPMVEYSVDENEFQTLALSQTGEVYTLPIATGLDANRLHRLDIIFRAADLEQQRWRTSMSHLRLAGLVLDHGGSLEAPPVRAKRAIIYGDSITEGVGSEGLFKSWTEIEQNNARVTWCAVVCAALNCEYGQLGSGGLGVSNSKLEMPPLTDMWDHFDAATSRLKDGLLQPEPDYIFCELGTNDPGLDISQDYVRWLTVMRNACPHARFFCIVPPLGVHQAEVEAAVSNRNKADDSLVYVIETELLKEGFRAGQGSTEFAYDGVHPSVFGHAMLGSLIAVEAQKVMSGHK